MSKRVKDTDYICLSAILRAKEAKLLSRAGHKLAGLIGDNLSTESTKTTIELNLALLRITHEVARKSK